MNSTQLSAVSLRSAAGGADWQVDQLRRLTFLRFVAAFVVLVFHFRQGCRSLAFGEGFWSHANSATSFFFMLSGFILGNVYQRRAGWSLADFYRARLARIAPLYLLATFPLAVVLFYHRALGWFDFGLTTLLLQAWIPGHAHSPANQPGWSLSVELFFYLVFPLLLNVFQRVRSLPAMFVWMISLWAANLCLYGALLQPVLSGHGSPRLLDGANHHPLMHLCTFLIGVLGAGVYSHHGARLRRFAVGLFLGGIALLVAIGLSDSPLLVLYHNGLFTPMFLMIVLGLALGQGSAFDWLACRPLRFLGEISYGIYILQMPAYFLYGQLAARWRLPLVGDAFFWPFCAALILLAWLSYRWYEQPMRRLLGGKTQRPASQPAAGALQSSQSTLQA